MAGRGQTLRGADWQLFICVAQHIRQQQLQQAFYTVICVTFCIVCVQHLLHQTDLPGRQGDCSAGQL